MAENEHEYPPRTGDSGHLHLIPEHLRADALGFFSLLGNLPKQLPKACPYCYCTRFKVKQKRNCKCNACGQGFSALTGTPLHRLQGTDRFRAFAEDWLAGRHIQDVAKRFGMDKSTVRNWIERFLQFMEETHPELHRWWSSRLYRLELEFPPHIEVQAIRFLDWLERVPNEPSTSCPRCGSSDIASHGSSGLPRWMCKQCGRLHNRLTGTPLHRLNHRPLWRPYTELMLRGYTHQDCLEQLGLDEYGAQFRSLLWRERFLSLIKEREPELLRWFLWQSRRRRGQLSREYQERRRADMLGTSAVP